MRKISIIGIGVGDPDHLTFQAINALNMVDVFFIPDKGAEKAALRDLRMEICARFIKGQTHRFIDMKVPKRAQDFADYKANVLEWHAEIEANYEKLLAEELCDGERGAFLVWGDPTLYDSTLRIIEAIHAKARVAFEYEVIPGVSSVQALAAAHRIPLNGIGESVLITTGRKLAEGFPSNADSVVVLLDGDRAFRRVADEDLYIYWGAYLGGEEEILIAGKLSEVMEEIEAVREQARAKNGWIMDAYLLRKLEK